MLLSILTIFVLFIFTIIATTVYMSVLKELTASTLFLAQASQNVPEVDTSGEEESISVLTFLNELVDSYFLQRFVVCTLARLVQVCVIWWLCEPRKHLKLEDWTGNFSYQII